MTPVTQELGGRAGRQAAVHSRPFITVLCRGVGSTRARGGGVDRCLTCHLLRVKLARLRVDRRRCSISSPPRPPPRLRAHLPVAWQSGWFVVVGCRDISMSNAGPGLLARGPRSNRRCVPGLPPSPTMPMPAFAIAKAIRAIWIYHIAHHSCHSRPGSCPRIVVRPAAGRQSVPRATKAWVVSTLGLGCDPPFPRRASLALRPSR